MVYFTDIQWFAKLFRLRVKQDIILFKQLKNNLLRCRFSKIEWDFKRVSEKDICFGGSVFKTRGIKSERVVAYQKIYDLSGREGITGGTLKEVPDVCIFLHTLLKRLKNNEDKYLTSSSLFNSLRDAVVNNSPNVPQFGTKQGAGNEDGEFIFIKR